LPPELLQKFHYFHDCFPFRDKRPEKRSSEDEEIRRLRQRLHELAAKVRRKRGDELVEEYRRVILQLLDIESWNGHLDLVCQLPLELMPEELFHHFDYRAAMDKMDEQRLW
jgi:hypothetical protein